MHSMTTFVGRSKRTDTISIYGKSYNIRKSQCFLFSSLHDAWRSILRNLHKRYIEYARRKEKTKIRIKMIAKNSTHVCHARFKVNVSSWYLPAMCGFSAKWEIILSSPEVRSALKAVFFLLQPIRFCWGRWKSAAEVFEHNHYVLQRFFTLHPISSLAVRRCGGDGGYLMRKNSWQKNEKENLRCWG